MRRDENDRMDKFVATEIEKRFFQKKTHQPGGLDAPATRKTTKNPRNSVVFFGLLGILSNFDPMIG